MEPPRRMLDRIFEFCAVLALSAFLLRLAVCYLLEIWPYLLAAATIVLIGIIGWRVYKFYHSQGKW